MYREIWQVDKAFFNIHLEHGIIVAFLRYFELCGYYIGQVSLVKETAISKGIPSKIKVILVIDYHNKIPSSL